jgi:nucleotide-binding universal stress UspA family protein
VTRYLDNVEAEKEATRRLNEMLRREERAAKDYQYGASPNRQRFSAPQPEVLVKSGCAWEQILKAAEKLPADLIVVGGHEHGLPESTICVGTGTATASKARCPTLIVKREGVELKPASHEHGGHI